MIDTKMSNDKKTSLGRGDNEANNGLPRKERKDPPNNRRHKRRLRARERKTRYIEEFVTDSDDDDIEVRKFDVMEKLQCDRFSSDNYNCVKELPGSEITLEYFQRNGFEMPILVKENTNNALGMKIPPSTFTVDDVKSLVGPRRVLDVMDVETQLADTMSMKEWCTYYNNPERDRLLNVISLEFSHTKLENYIDSPKFVKQMDWVDLVWPRHLKKAQREGTNALHVMKYPKVQKYCLMSVKGCYTDFHIDFGGTSVWYHILRGGKVFWLIPPTEKNIQLYEQWTLSGKQSDIFFGDTVENCARVHLTSGNTFLIPTGWIHAVYTEEDSLVFGGNFLHSYGIEKQLRVSQVEDITKVPNKFRYPFYTEIMWYVLVRYLHCLTGKNYLTVDDEGHSLLVDENKDQNNIKNNNIKQEVKKEEEVEVKEEPNDSNNKSVSNGIKSDPYDTDTEDEDIEEIERQLKLRAELMKSKMPTKPFISFVPGNARVHLSKFELSGLRAVVQYLSQLSPSKRSIPELIISPERLLNDVRFLIEEHLADDHELSVTNRPILFWLSKKALSMFANGHGTTKSRNRQPHVTPLNGAMKRPKSPLGSSNNSDSGIGGIQYKVSSGTTLKNDLIPSSFEGLIAQTGRGTGGFLFNRSLGVSCATSSTTTPSVSKVTTPINVVTTKVATSPTYTPKSPQTPAPPLPPASSYQNHQYSYGQVNYHYPNHQAGHNNPFPQQQAAISAEHAYNQSPALYQNPHMHHNYAYHPYRQASRPYTAVTSHAPVSAASGRATTAQLPIRPIPTVVQSPTASHNVPTTIHKPTAQVATVQMPVIVRPVAATPTYVQPQQVLQATTYQTSYQAPQATTYPSYVQQQPAQPQQNGQTYYQYYQPQVQVLKSTPPQQTQSAHVPLPAQPQAQLIYYHNNQSPAVQQKPQQSIIISPMQSYQPASSQPQSVVYNSVQYNHMQPSAATINNGLYTAPSPQPIRVDQPKNIYYVQNNTTMSQPPQAATNTYTYTPNQTYLMTPQPYQAAAQPVLVGHHQAMSSYVQPTVQSQVHQQSQYPSAQAHQQVAPGTAPTAVPLANISSFHYTYPSSNPPTYNIQYGR